MTSALFALILVLAWALAARCQDLHVRLETPVSSFASKAGAAVRAVTIAPYRKNREIVIPSGSTVLGSIRRVARVGMGMVRERAALDIEFDRYQLPDGRQVAFTARMAAVDNAREQVTAQGSIKGILAADNPQAFVWGVWLRPSMGLIPRSAMGLTGASGRLWTGFAMGPIGAAALFAARCVMFRMPEPEIQLPAGSELTLAVTALAEDAPSFPGPPEEQVHSSLDELLAVAPAEVTKPNGKLAADIINIAFEGPRELLIKAFSAAGWYPAEPLTPRSFARAYHAVTSGRGYPTAPMSRLLYEGQEPELVFQKSLNTLHKRHHIRIWPAGRLEDGEVWLGAATHDVGVTFQSRTMSISHRIDPYFDRERAKVINDLAFAGCTDPVAYLERPNEVRQGTGTSSPVTDGRLAILKLHDCTRAGQALMAEPGVPGTRTSRFVRRAMLETRQYLMRGNVYHWAYRLVRWRPTRVAEPVGVEE